MINSIDLQSIPTVPPKDINKQLVVKNTSELRRQLFELQNVLYASSSHSILILFQGLDASGKNSTIRKVFSGVDPTGCRVAPLTKPSTLEYSHDFLWRIHKEAPAKGMIKIFNRSHYEDLIVPVLEKNIYKEDLLRRYQFINQFEDLISYENNTLIFKFYLHISKTNQLKKLKKRLVNPRRKWKYDPNNFVVHSKWDEHVKIYQDIFKYCSSPYEWNIIPADKKWYRDYLVLKKIVEGIEKLDLKYPEHLKK